METTEARAKAGWYPHTSMPGMLRYWNGQKWPTEVPPRPERTPIMRPESPVGYIIGGFIISLVGGVLIGGGLSDMGAFAAFLGATILSIGGLMTTVGIIASGVRLGMRWALYERSQLDRLG